MLQLTCDAPLQLPPSSRNQVRRDFPTRAFCIGFELLAGTKSSPPPDNSRVDHRPTCQRKSTTSRPSSRCLAARMLPVRRPPIAHTGARCRHGANRILTYDTTAARIKKNKATGQTKFKVRCQRYLYTLTLKDSDKADKLKQSLPPGTLPFPPPLPTLLPLADTLHPRPHRHRDPKEERQGQAHRQDLIDDPTKA